MDNPEILDSLFREAVSAIDAGDMSANEFVDDVLRRHVANSLGSFMRANTPCGDQRDQHY